MATLRVPTTVLATRRPLVLLSRSYVTSTSTPAYNDTVNTSTTQETTQKGSTRKPKYARFIVSYNELEKQENPPPPAVKRLRTWRPQFQRYLRYPIENPKTGEIEWKAKLEGKQLVFLPNIYMKLVKPIVRPGEKYNPYEAIFHAPLQLTKPDIISYLEAVYPKLHPTYINTINVRSRYTDNLRRRTPKKKELKRMKLQVAYKKVIIGLRKGQEFWWPEDPPDEFMEENFGIISARRQRKAGQDDYIKKRVHGINTPPNKRVPMNLETRFLQYGYPDPSMHPKRRPKFTLYTYGRGPTPKVFVSDEVNELRQAMENERQEIYKRAKEIFLHVAGTPAWAESSPEPKPLVLEAPASEVDNTALPAPEEGKDTVAASTSPASVADQHTTKGSSEDVQKWWDKNITAGLTPDAGEQAVDISKMSKRQVKYRLKKLHREADEKDAENAFNALSRPEQLKQLYEQDPVRAWDAIVIDAAKERALEEKKNLEDPQTAWDQEEEDNPFVPLRSKWVGEWSELLRKTEAKDMVPEMRIAESYEEAQPQEGKL